DRLGGECRHQGPYRSRGAALGQGRQGRRYAGRLSRLMCAVRIPETLDFKVTLLGTGTPVLNVDRFGMSTLIEAGSRKLLFDAGRGVSIRLHQARVPLRSIDAVFITHLHSDHIAGLPDFYATSAQGAGGRRAWPLNLHGPAGIDN